MIVYYCPICKSTDVEQKAWIHLNNPSVVDIYGDEYYCNCCNDFISMIEYQEDTDINKEYLDN